jgi:hypothetical protein
VDFLVNRTPGLSQQNGCHETDGHDYLLSRHDCVSSVQKPSRLIYWPGVMSVGGIDSNVVENR